MNLQDMIPNTVRPVCGEFEMTVRNTSGQIVEVYKDPNLVVNQAKNILVQLMLGNSDCIVNKIAFGNSMLTPLPHDTRIGQLETHGLFAGNNVFGDSLATYLKFVDSTATGALGVATFNWSLSYEEANGLNICEFGLLSNDQQLFARKTRGTITKQSDLAFEGTWRIIF